jgi:hypothetical protein
MRTQTKEHGQISFDAYNEAGAFPGLTWDKKPVPAWHDLSDDVRAKWAAGERAVGRDRLDAFGPAPATLKSFLLSALARFDQERFVHSAPLTVRVYLEILEDELSNPA